jgi:hypothetical protein
LRYSSFVLRKRSVLGLAAVLLACVFVPAQQTINIPVTIQVSDANGGAIAHAQVHLDPQPQNASADLSTDARGRVSIGVRPGDYTISVSAAGFKSESRREGFGVGDGPPAGQTVSIILQTARGTGGPVQSANTLLLIDNTRNGSTPLSLADFHALPHISITVHNGHTNAEESYSGVPLANLLGRINAPMGNLLRGDAMATYVVATGSDGYAVVLSLAEVDPGFRENQIIVADTRDGQPLGKNGLFQLIVPGDKRPARWVRNLVSITLKRTD